MFGAVFKRILAGIVILIATIAFLANAAGLAGVWIIRRPACDVITNLSTFVNDKLRKVDQAFERVGTRTDKALQAVARVDSAANAVGDRFEQSSPLMATLNDAVRDELAPRIAEMRAQAAALRDGAVAVNAALETLDSFPYIKVPTFSDKLSAISERIDAAQTDAQALRGAIDQARTATPANLATAVTERTTKIGNMLAKIKSTTIKYQTVVAEQREQVITLSRRLLRVINLLVLSLTALFVVVAAGQVLLIYVCWQYVRRGRFPLLRVARVNFAAP